MIASFGGGVVPAPPLAPDGSAAPWEGAGMRFSAFSDGGRRAEILELNDHPFFMGTQYHPEYCSRPEYPEPMFLAFMKAAMAAHEQKGKKLQVAARSA